MADQTTIVEYAIRYCITRQSYAFIDGLDLAEENWEHLSDATKRDVVEACTAAMQPGHWVMAGRWPQIERYAPGADRCR